MTVLKFINDFVGGSKDIVKRFSEGYCYYFARMLQERFDGVLYYFPVENHFVCKIGGQLYDVKGVFESEYDGFPWSTYKTTEPWDAAAVEKYCIMQEED